MCEEQPHLPDHSLNALTRPCHIAHPFGRVVGGLKTVVVKEGHEQAFQALFAELREAILQREPGCLVYALMKSRTTPRAYIVQEQYVDEDALEAHVTAPYSDTLFPAIRRLLERIEVEYFDGINPSFCSTPTPLNNGWEPCVSSAEPARP